MIDQDGYVHVLSRADDVMNVAGHRLSTSLLEQGEASALTIQRSLLNKCLNTSHLRSRVGCGMLCGGKA